MRKLPQWEFDIYALSLPRGHGFGDQPPTAAWITEDGRTCAIATLAGNEGPFGYLFLRRRIDFVWVVTAESNGFDSLKDTMLAIEPLMVEGKPLEPMTPGAIIRPRLFDLKGREPSDVFKVLARPSHAPAAWALNQLYLALPKPDRNWVSDCQTKNFHTRLWEAQLLAGFREQGLLVTQPYESPDFHIANRFGGEAWVEAVTANPTVPYNHVNAAHGPIPTEKDEVFFGAAALRFAKTLGNKLNRGYDRLPHVAGKSFMIAIADFQAPASMMWSREGLIGYLYGEGAQVAMVDGRAQAVAMPATHLLGPSAFPAGLFADDRHSELSAVIFSNACSIAKLYRVPISGSVAPKGLRYIRIGHFFDRTPGALVGVPFCLDITSDEYRALWPQGYEPWSAEMEVFHNPFASHPVSFDLLPEATHWFEQDGEKRCSTIYETSVLWSRTMIQDEDQRPLILEDFLSRADHDA
ncbi:hypothetical protein NOI24_24605 [Neorhizobium galegae]|uniref:hypothetical protein n=1 Tax=Neorhizobium galegae TaxID=399 RepID=UPI0021063A3D|nr:hypothetical protein [Neorhizobium galegae]MCQ1774492.1 hypothetical protein [Neorhizobium galegae]MCQ1799255.1 hypothetical protein [Neorhizobium galegae]